MLSLNDLKLTIVHWRVWLFLGWQDIRIRYRRSQIGPFWIAISTGFLIYSMGFLYGHLFKLELSHYYIFLASGIITWNLLSGIITESNEAFIEARQYITQLKIPYTTYIMRVIIRNMIVFLHNLITVIPIIIYFKIRLSILSLLSVFFGLFIIALSGLFYGTILAIIGTRYRDTKPIITSVIQILFLLTPIVWEPNMVPRKYALFFKLNPFTHFIDLIRSGLMGRFPSELSVIFSLSASLLGIILFFILFERSRKRIAFWV